MTRYSRSVIPGRPQGEDGNASEIDKLVFGKGGAKPAAADEDEPDFLPPAEEKDLIDRAGADRRKGGRRRKSDFAALPEEARGFRPTHEGAKRGPLLLVGALVIVGVFSVVVWNAYRDGVKTENPDAAVQLADAGSFKTKPDPTTAAKADGDVQAGVFDQIEKTAKSTAQPAPEVRDQPAAPAAAVAPPPAASVAKTPTPIAAPPVKVGPAIAVKTAMSVPAPAAAATAAKPVAPVTADNGAKPVSPAVVPPAAAKPAAPKALPVVLGGASAPAFAVGGPYVVQIAAPSTEAAATAEWDKRAKASPDLFGAAEKIIVKADVNGRTVYRLRVGSFATPADAEAFCTAFKAKGGACFRTAK
jgi:SPOR domain